MVRDITLGLLCFVGGFFIGADVLYIYKGRARANSAERHIGSPKKVLSLRTVEQAFPPSEWAEYAGWGPYEP